MTLKDWDKSLIDYLKQIPDERKAGEWIAIDGKSLKNTVNDCYGQQQNFVMMVSALTHEGGEILGIKVRENKKQSEIVAVQDLLELLHLKGVVFTIDALHCQKKQSQQLSTVVITT